MAAEQPILDLSTLIPDRPAIRIDGETYHLRAADELSLAESHQFTLWGKLLEEPATDPEQAAKLDQLLAKVADEALADVPPAVRLRLNRTHHIAIVEVFTVLLLGHRARQAGAIASAVDQSTGQRPSRGFSMPLAATPAGGSTPPQPPSSGPM